MKTVAQQLTEAREAADLCREQWLACKDKTNRHARQLAKEAAEALEFWTNKVCMLSVMARKGM